MVICLLDWFDYLGGITNGYSLLNIPRLLAFPFIEFPSSSLSKFKIIEIPISENIMNQTYEILWNIDIKHMRISSIIETPIILILKPQYHEGTLGYDHSLVHTLKPHEIPISLGWRSKFSAREDALTEAFNALESAQSGPVVFAKRWHGEIGRDGEKTPDLMRDWENMMSNVHMVVTYQSIWVETKSASLCRNNHETSVYESSESPIRVTKGHFSDFLFGQMSFVHPPGKRLAAHQLPAKPRLSAKSLWSQKLDATIPRNVKLTGIFVYIYIYGWMDNLQQGWVMQQFVQ